MTVLRFALIALLTLIFVGCSSETPAPITPTVDVPTIAAPTPDIEATVQARVAQELAAQPTDAPTAVPTPTIDISRFNSMTPVEAVEALLRLAGFSEDRIPAQVQTFKHNLESQNDPLSAFKSSFAVNETLIEKFIFLTGVSDNAQVQQEVLDNLLENNSETTRSVVDSTPGPTLTSCINSTFTVSGVISGYPDGSIVEGVLDGESIGLDRPGAGGYTFSVDLCDENGQSIENQYMKINVNGNFTGQEVILFPNTTVSRNLTADQVSAPSTTASGDVVTSLPPQSTKYEGGYVMFISYIDNLWACDAPYLEIMNSPVTLKVNGYTATENICGEIYESRYPMLLDIHANSKGQKTSLSGDTGNHKPVLGIPRMIAGRAYIDGEYAPDGSVVSLWYGDEEVVSSRTIVNNNPVEIMPRPILDLLSKRHSMTVPTPCPAYMGCTKYNYPERLLDEKIYIFDQKASSSYDIYFYTTDPDWALTNNVTEDYLCKSGTDQWTFGGAIGVTRDLQTAPNQLGTGKSHHFTVVNGDGWHTGGDGTRLRGDCP